MSTTCGVNNSPEFLSEVINNVKCQLSLLDSDVASDGPQDKNLRDIHAHLDNMISKANVLSRKFSKNSTNGESNDAVELKSSHFLNLKNLRTTVEELDYEIRECEYDYFRVVADLLIDIRDQLRSFEAFGALPCIVETKQRIIDLENELKRRIMFLICDIGQLMDEDENGNYLVQKLDEHDLNVRLLTKAYLLTDIFRGSICDDLLTRFAQLQLIPYEADFQFGKKYGDLENVEKRYIYFRKLLKRSADLIVPLFPKRWRIPLVLHHEFVRRTKVHLLAELTDLDKSDKKEVDPPAYVALILTALKTLTACENEIKGSFPSIEELEIEDALPDGMNTNAVYATETCTDIFEKYLGPFVKLERLNLDETVGRLLFEEEEVLNGSSNVPAKNGQETVLSAVAAASYTETAAHVLEPLESAQRMFEYMKASMKRCSGISTGSVLVNLSREFLECLLQYVDSIKFRCPTPAQHKETQYNINDSLEAALCRIMSTANFCAELIPQLENGLRSLVDVKKSNPEDIDFSSAVEKNLDLTSHVIGILAAATIEKFDSPFRTMRHINWSDPEYRVGDDSAYVKELIGILKGDIPRLRAQIESTYFLVLCSKVALAALEGFLATIWRLKRVSKQAGAQLLLDLNGLKECLMSLPHLKLDDNAEDKPNISGAFKNQVNNKTSSVEAILKLVCLEDEALEEMFPIIWPDGTPEDLENVRGLKYSGTRTSAVVDAVGDIKDVVEDSTNAAGKAVLGVGKGAFSGIKSGVTGVTSLGGRLLRRKSMLNTEGDDDGASINSQTSDAKSEGSHSTIIGDKADAAKRVATKAFQGASSAFSSFSSSISSNIFDAPQTPSSKTPSKGKKTPVSTPAKRLSTTPYSSRGNF